MHRWRKLTPAAPAPSGINFPYNLELQILQGPSIRFPGTEGPLSSGDVYPSRSMMVALAMPPPSHIVCRP
jgi:hypothetical protein